MDIPINLSIVITLLLLFTIVLCYFIPRWTVTFLSRKLQKYIPVSVQVSRIGILWGEEISLRFFNGEKLLIQRARLTSNLFDSSAKCLVTVIVSNMEYSSSLSGATLLLAALKSRDSRQSVLIGPEATNRVEKGWMVTLSQFIGVHIQNIAIKVELAPRTRMTLALYVDELSLRFTLDPLHMRIDVGAKCFRLKLLRLALMPLLPGEEEGQMEDERLESLWRSWSDAGPLASISCHVGLDIVLGRYRKGPKVDLLHVRLYDTNICVMHEMASELEDAAASLLVDLPSTASVSSLHHPGPGAPQYPSCGTPGADQELLFQVMPREASLEVDNIHCEILRLAADKNIRLTWSSFLISATRTKLEEDSSGLSARISLQGFKTESVAHHFASLNKIEVACVSDYNSMTFNVILDNPFFSYIHEEILFWHRLVLSCHTMYRSSRSSLTARLPALATHHPVLAGVVKPDSSVIIGSGAISSGTILPGNGPNVPLTTANPMLVSLLRGRRLAVKLEVNCMCRGVEVDPNSRVAIRFLRAEGQPGLEIGIKSWTLNLETDRLYVKKNAGISAADFHSEMNTMYCKWLDAPTNMSDYHDGVHYWNTVVYLGNCFVWGHKLRLGVFLGSVQLEWSPQFARVVDLFLPLVLPLVHTSSQWESTNERGKKSFLSRFADVDLDIKLEHINLFALSDKDVFLMHRLDCLQLLNKVSSKASLSIKSAQMVYDRLHPTSTQHPIKACDEIEQSATVSLPELTLHYDHLSKQVLVLCNEKVTFYWTVAMHLCLKDALDTIQETLLGPLFLLHGSLGSPSQQAEQEIQHQRNTTIHSQQTQGDFINITLQCLDWIELYAQISDTHHVRFLLDRLQGGVADSKSKWSANQFIACFDQHEILVMQTVTLKSNHHVTNYRTDKEKLNLKTATNKTWEFLCDGCYVTFPYKYNFYDCWHDTVTIRKFLRNLHKNTADPSGSLQTIPPDIIILITKVVFVIKDDPFEAKLGVIFPIQLDENIQHAKRFESLAAKLNKPNSTYSETERQAYFAKLEQERPAQYIARMTRYYSRFNVSDSLFTWTMDNVRLTSLADSDYHGKENVLRHMRDIDRAGVPPDPNFKWTILWCRMINLNIELFSLVLRDFSKSLWEIKDLLLWGRLLGAENAPDDRAKRRVYVTPGDPWSEYEVIRSMPPLKFYHDFSADMKEMKLCYGPNWEPCFAWLNLSLDLINRSSRDPSPPMPWWDKSRLKLHGRLCFAVETMQWLYPTSLDPYNSSDFFEWKWTDLMLNWTNMLFLLEGNLDIYCLTASKYDGDCRLLHIPNLELQIKLDWLCLGNPNDHHNVMPCNPLYILPLEPGQIHDSYHLFRSRNVVISFIFTARPSQNNTTCIFYTNILKFLDKLKMCFTKMSRPIRKGKQFNCIKPKKAILTRICKRILLKVYLPRLDLSYWVSFSKKNGVRMFTGPISMETDFGLDLIPWNDGLKRRPRADWSVERMRAEVTDGRVWLRHNDSVSDSVTSYNKISGVPQGAEEFMIMPTIRYERARPSQIPVNRPACFVNPGLSALHQDLPEPDEAMTSPSTTSSTGGHNPWTSPLFSGNGRVTGSLSGSTPQDTLFRGSLRRRSIVSVEAPSLDSQICGGHTSINTDTQDRITHEELTPVHRVELRDLKVRWTERNRDLVYSMMDTYRHAQSLNKNLSAQALKAVQLKQPSSPARTWGHTPTSPVHHSNPLPGNNVDVSVTTTTNASRQIDVPQGLTANHVTAARTPNEPLPPPFKLDGDTSPVLLRTPGHQTNSSLRHSGPPFEVFIGAERERVEKEEAERSRSKFLTDIPMLNQLLQEVDTAKFYAYCEEEPKQVNVVNELQGVALCQTTEVLSRNWHVELINSQVLLKTTELSGYVIVSAARTRLDSLDHRPVWRDSQLLTKSTLVGKLECMQYYATVGQVDPSAADQWLSSNDVEDHDVGTEDLLSGKPEVVGCGKAVGGVVSACVGQPGQIVQLQRMISRCTCHVFYVNYDQADPNTIPTHIIPPLPLEENEVLSTTEGANTFTLVHRTLNICTNSLQYHMIVDLVNDLLLYIEPQRKARLEENRMKFSLKTEESFKTDILTNQEELRNLVQTQRKMERELWELTKERPVNMPYDTQIAKQKQVEGQIQKTKTKISERNAALTLLISSYQQRKVQNQRQLHSTSHHQSQPSQGGQSGTVGQPPRTNQPGETSGENAGDSGNASATEEGHHSEIIRRDEVCFEHARWRMTETDGQIGLADVELRGFVYNKVNRADETGAHHLKLGWMKVENLSPNCFYKDVLMPNTSSEMYNGTPVLRIACMESGRVGGIQVKEVLEINVAPLVLQVSKQFFRTMMPYFFPDKSDDGQPLQLSSGATLTVPGFQSSAAGGSDLADTYSETNSTPTPKRRNILRGGRKKSNPSSSAAPSALSQPSGPLPGPAKPSFLALPVDDTTVLMPSLASEVSLVSISHGEGSGLTPTSELSRGVGWESGANLTVEEALFVPHGGSIAVVVDTADLTNESSANLRSGSSLLNPHQALKQRQHADHAIKEPSLLERMSERARKNNVFHYIKIPEFPLQLSYKGEKQKNLSDVVDFQLTVPMIEYRQVTWTWLDLAMEVKTKIRKELIKEVIKKKLTLRRRQFNRPQLSPKLKEEDREKKKMEMLLGRHANQKETEKKRSSIFRRGSKL